MYHIHKFLSRTRMGLFFWCIEGYDILGVELDENNS